MLKIDATCADAEVRYPVDVDLVHDGCKAIDGIISKVCASLGISVIKTCYKDARRFYLELVKRKKKGGKLVRSVMSAMLDYLHIDLRRTTGMCYFVKNVMKFLRELCHALIEIWHMLLAQVTCGGNVCYPMVLAKY